MAKKKPTIAGNNGGLVPIKYWQRSFQLSVVPDDAAPYIKKIGDRVYMNTKHPEYTRWYVGFVTGAARAIGEAVKRQTN